jgi:hypothetical protein
MADFFAKGKNPINGYGGGDIKTAEIALSAGCKIKFYKKGGLCWFNVLGTGATITHGAYFEIPSEFRPKEIVDGNTSTITFAGVGAGTGETKIPFTAIFTSYSNSIYIFFYIQGGGSASIANLIGFSGNYVV